MIYLGVFILGGMCGVGIMSLLSINKQNEVMEFNKSALEGQELD